MSLHKPNRPLVVAISGDPELVRTVETAMGTDCRTAVLGDLDRGIAEAEAGSAAIVLLDHPTADLDPILAACRRLRTPRAGEPPTVLVVDRGSSAADRVRAYEAGADDVLPWPVEACELVAKVGVHLRHRRTLATLDHMEQASERTAARIGDIVDEQARSLIIQREVTVRALAALAESRDAETGEHLDRMRDYAVVLAETLRRVGPYADLVDAGFIEQLEHAAPLHDIGKVAIPDAVLRKPGPLTPDEYEIMKAHTETGARVLEVVRSLESDGGIDDAASWMGMAIEIARSHHERWDGAGYPDGLTGRLIPLSARITSVADVFDALTTSRVYKAAFPVEKARSMIREGRGTQFDPVLVQAFDAGWEDLLRVHRRFEPAPGADLRRTG